MIIFQGGEENDFVSYFTIYHFAAGFIVGYLGLPLLYWFILHLIFEICENVFIRIPQTGTLIRKIEYNYMKILNSITKYLGFIVKTPPYNGDSLENCIGDITISISGWLLGNIFSQRKIKYL